MYVLRIYKKKNPFITKQGKTNPKSTLAILTKMIFV